jgi:hypothetical protein
MTHAPITSPAAGTDRLIVAPDHSYAYLTPTDADPAVRLWTTRRLPFESDQTADQKAMVAELAPVIRSIPLTADQVLHGLFISDQTQRTQPDAENITFYNWRTGDHHSPFANATGHIAFERWYTAAPPRPAPLPGAARFHHIWAARPADQVPQGWETDGDPLAEWHDVACPVVFGDDAGRHVWRAMREQHDKLTVHAARWHAGRFGVRVELTLPRDYAQRPASDAVKGCVDGAIAAFQGFDERQLEAAAELLARHAAWPRWQTPIESATFTKLARGTERQRLFDGAPFNGNGLNPCDDRCVAGRLQVTRDDVELPHLSGWLFSLRPAVAG